MTQRKCSMPVLETDSSVTKCKYDQLATPASPLSMRRSHTRSDSRGRPRALERPARVRVVAYCFPCLTSRSYPIMPKTLVHVDGNWRQPTPSITFTFCPTINLASTMFDTGHPDTGVRVPCLNDEMAGNGRQRHFH